MNARRLALASITGHCPTCCRRTNSVAARSSSSSSMSASACVQDYLEFKMKHNIKSVCLLTKIGWSSEAQTIKAIPNRNRNRNQSQSQSQSPNRRVEYPCFWRSPLTLIFSVLPPLHTISSSTRRTRRREKKDTRGESSAKEGHSVLCTPDLTFRWTYLITSHHPTPLLPKTMMRTARTTASTAVAAVMSHHGRNRRQVSVVSQ